MGIAANPARLETASQHERFREVYALLEAAVASRIFPGCAFGVLQGDRVVGLDGVGAHTYAADAPPVLPSTIYDLASVTKVVAATPMAMLLYQRGLLQLDWPLASILPEFACELSVSDARQQITLRQLLGHCSGLPGYARLFEAHPTPAGLLQACCCLPLDHPPGTHAEYSDIGFILLGKALAAIAGEPIDTFCQREVFAPCGMLNTGYRPKPEMRPSIPPTEDDTTFRHRVIQGEVQDENCWVLGGVSGHAGLFGDVHDLLRFAHAVLQSAGNEQDATNALLSQPSLDLFSTRVEQPPGTSRALGWDTPSASSSGPSSAGTMFSTRSIGHLGYSGTSLWIDLRARIAIILLSNRTWPSRDNQAIRTLRPRFHDLVRSLLANSTTSVSSPVR